MSEVSLKEHATTLLRRYDRLRRELRETELELGKAVTEYGRATRRWGLSKDHFRSELEREAMLEQAAERDAWEKANA